ncbi:MAG: DUF1579 domain-containing protein [Planctomycetota bacterium]|nr:DUF1579 domain-containing protein [Planctomycetota bacterium]
MRRWFVSCSVVLIALISTSVEAFAQAPQSPGKEHEELKALEGTWDAAMTMEGSEVKGVSEFKMTCEGMWLSSDFRADFGGMKFHGKGLDGYDSSKKQYVGIWVDSMSGSPMVMTGTKEGKVTTMTGSGPGPAGDAKYKTISKMVSNDEMKFQMFITSDGKDTELMTITYTRRK